MTRRDEAGEKREVRPPRPKTTREYLQGLDISVDRIERTLVRMEQKVGIIVALSTEELAAVQDLSDDIDRALAAATAQVPALQQAITDITAQRDALQADDDADQASIDALNAGIVTMQAALDSHASEVVEALTSLDQRVEGFIPAPA